jgi:hypothetical protein
MRHGFRYSSFLLVSALLLCCAGSSPAQQIHFEDFSDVNYANKYLSQNYSYKNGNSPYLTTYQGNYVLRLTEGGSNKIEASTVYFNVPQAVLGFTTWFKFQAHRPLGCCNPGDGVAFIIQNSNATDGSMGASGSYITALGAGGNPAYLPQAGGMGYAGIDNSLVIEFDTVQDAWDPNGNHIAVQTCGTGVNTPVHDSGVYQIGQNHNVTSCLYVNNNVPAINTTVAALGGSCIPGAHVCSDGSAHDVVIIYSPPSQPGGQGVLDVYLDPPFQPGTHIPQGGAAKAVSIPYTINSQSGLNLGTGAPCLPNIPCSALVGFTASQPGETGYTADAAQDILGWEFNSDQLTQPVPPGGIENIFNFGPHIYGVTYPIGFMPPQGLQMTVVATGVDRYTFYQTRLAGTKFANEQCIVYEGTGGLQPNASGNCLLYTVTCQQCDMNGCMPVSCPTELKCDPIKNPNQCIDLQTMFYTMDPLNGNNADFLEAPSGTNMWCSIFTMLGMDGPADDGPPGKGTGFTLYGKGTGFSDFVGTFVPGGMRMNNGGACPP